MKSLNMVFWNIKNMVIRNTNFKKIYLLAGVIMAANMFVGNEMKATDTTLTTNIQEKREPEEENNTDKIFLYTDDIEQEDNDEKAPGAQPKSNILDKLLSHENAFNLFGGLVSSGFNNYLKWWDYNPGMYCKPVWLGWRSKRFLYGVLQFEVNFNVVRGILWLIPGVFGLMQYIKKKEHSIIFKSTAGLIAIKTLNKGEKININNKANIGIFYFIIFLFQGFGSIPLTLHFSNFSISISLDSMIWGVIGFFLDKKDEEEKGGEERKNNGPNNGGNAENNEGDNKNENEENIENNNLDDSRQRITTTF